MAAVDLIVMFREFHRPRAVRTILHEALGGVGGSKFTLVRRHNAAARLPTDFALVRLASTRERTRAMRALHLHHAVRMAAPERQYVDRGRRAVHSSAADAATEPQGGGRMAPKERRARAERRPSVEARGRNATKLCGGAEAASRRCILGRLARTRPRHGGERTAETVGTDKGRRLLYSAGLAAPSPPQVATRLHAEALWRLGYAGKGVHVAVFDTGLAGKQDSLRHVEEVTNWTDEESSEDHVGHGTFVAGVIASDASASGCRGLAPEATLHIYKVFNSKQVSYTSWFLDAFNYAIHRKVHIVNLSIGGPDSADKPFMRKVGEAAAAGIIVVSGIGNSGPLWGSLMNPADMTDVLGVGGVNDDHSLSDFSSRGMTIWELPDGYGRVKPDVLTYASRVMGLSTTGGCRALSGTSVACPVVTGATALLASSIPEPQRWALINPASLKQVVTGSARRLPLLSAFEQGAGLMDLLGAAQMLSEYTPQVTVVPAELDLSPCPAHGRAGRGGYLWPLCSQPLYYGAVPMVLNLTIINGMALHSNITRPPSWKSNGRAGASLLSFRFERPLTLSPWGGSVGVAVEVTADGATFDGLLRGELSFEVESLSGPFVGMLSTVVVPFTVAVTRPPARRRRILIDQWHSLAYPPAYVPRDDLAVTDELLDWNGDHLHTNLREFYIGLRERGFFVETLGCPLLCFNASQYAALLLVDSEDEFTPAERVKLSHDVIEHGLSVVVLADWYSVPVMKALRFYDENTHSRWVPVTGGSNVPALNELLAPFGISFSDQVYRGELPAGPHVAPLASAVSIAAFPAGGWLLRAPVLEDEGARIAGVLPFTRTRRDVPMLGLLQPRAAGAGRVVAFGDSECTDFPALRREGEARTRCWWLLQAILDFACEGNLDRELFPDSVRLSRSFRSMSPLPTRDKDAKLSLYSRANREANECLLARLGMRPPVWTRSSPKSLPFPLDEGSLAHWPLSQGGSADASEYEVEFPTTDTNAFKLGGDDVALFERGARVGFLACSLCGKAQQNAPPVFSRHGPERGVMPEVPTCNSLSIQRDEHWMPGCVRETPLPAP
ncbi:hypothetical protein AB1Y20_004060 [Prymnesium parvum]|uniref:Subtilisin n=1 Tax=Prymnesium parvum TaxID=97485 RepID=A0AB34J8B8_PRYPA